MIHYYSARRLKRRLTGVLFAAVVVSILAPATPASANITHTMGDAWGTPELAGSDSRNMGGNGVTTYSNGPTYAGPEVDTLNYVNTPSSGSVQSGIEWQCVELVNRLYLTKGWITSRWEGLGGQMFGNAASKGLTPVANGSITSVSPGDGIFMSDGGVGHAAYVGSVSGNSITIVNQNSDWVFSDSTLSNGWLSDPWDDYTVQGIVKAPGTAPPVDPTNSVVSSQVVNGVQHVYKGTADGKVWDISWGNGSPLTQWTPATGLGGQVTGLSSQVVNGVQHVYAAVGSTVRDISWGNGAPLTQWTVGSNLATPVSALSSQVINGVHHVYATSNASVWDISWGNGSPLSQWVVGNNVDATTAGLSSQVINGVQHVYKGTTDGKVWDISWGNGSPLSQWTPSTTLGTTTAGVSSQVINGVQHVYIGTASAVWDISWGNGSPLSQWVVGSNLGGNAPGISSQVVNGVQHVYKPTTSGSVWDISWGNGSPLTQWVVGSGLGSNVYGISSQVINGVHHVYADAKTVAWDISWGNGSPLTQWTPGTGL